MNKGKAESGNAPLEKDKENSFSLGPIHAGIIWSMKTLHLDHHLGVIGLILQCQYSKT